jgi:hypothetical protein
MSTASIEILRSDSIPQGVRFTVRRCTPLLLVALLTALASIVVLSRPASAAFTQQNQFGSGTTITLAWGDGDGDGDLDVAVGRHGSGNLYFINNGDGTFTQQAQFGGGSTFVVLWADPDNDGDLDMAIGRGTNQQNSLCTNNGDGTFTLANQFGALSTIGLAWADYDLDGDLDLAVGNGILGAVHQNYLYINNGDGTYTGQPQFGTGQTCAVAWGDFDGDGDADLAAGNGGFGYVGQNYLYVNNGDGTFTERPEFGLGDTAALAWGDCDNDGDLDLAVGNWNATGCALYINNGDGTFTTQSQFGSRDTNTLNWGDFDNDGDLDLAVGNGDFSSADQNYLYVNNSDGTFTETAEFGLGSTDALAWGDCDDDGDLDMAVGNEHSPAQNYLCVNDGNSGERLTVHLVGHRHSHGAGYSNRDGIGAKVSVYEDGFVGDPAHLLSFREIEARGGFSAQNAIDAHFGLPGVAAVDLRIVWPGSSGTHFTQDLPGVTVGQRITVDEAASGQSVGHGGGRLEGALRAWPNPAPGTATVEFTAEPVDGAARLGSLTIFDSSGRLVRSLRWSASGAAGALHATWDGRLASGEVAPPGAYFARAASGGGGRRLVRIK